MAVVLAVALGVGAFGVAAHGRLNVGPARIDVAVTPSLVPRTVVEIPPVGTVEAPTHRGPVKVVVRLNEVDLVATSRMLERDGLSLPDIGSGSADSLPVAGLGLMLAKLLGVGLLAAAAAATLLAMALRRRRLVVALAVALAVAVPAGACLVAYSSWDASAFREPTLRGNLTYAPQIVDVFSTRVANIKRLRGEAAKIASQIVDYYAGDRSLAAGGAFPGTYRVLHVTDLHLDPVGAQLARSLARSYDASLVVDTGDLPIFGTPIESTTFASLVDTSVAQVYVPGNHDSPESLAALRRLGVTVLATGTVEVGGLRIFGVPDPISRGFGVEPNDARIDAATARAVSSLRSRLRSGEPTPDIVAVHNPRMQWPFVGLVPLVLSGHTHAAGYEFARGTALLNSGTTGGIGRSSVSKRRLPYSASVLYYSAARPRRLLAIDRISVYPNRSMTISREVMDGAGGPERETAASP